NPAGLQDNGGATQTIALLPASLAIDAIPVSQCSVATDQRGVSRLQGPRCDIGAFEVALPSSSTVLTSPRSIVIDVPAAAAAVSQSALVNAYSSGNSLTVPFTATPAGGSWLTATPGTVTPATSVITVASAGLTQGTYSGT